MGRMRVLIVLIFSGVIGTGCSLYESTARKDIESNSNGILGSYGTSADQRLAYDCTATRQEPDFLKEPLDAVQTQYETDGFMALTDKHSAPGYLAMERSTQAGVFVSCKVRFLASISRSDDGDFSEAITLAHDEIIKLENRL